MQDYFTSLRRSPHGFQPRSISDRFWEKVDKSGDCWIWTGCRHAQGYGQMRIGSKADGTYTVRRATRICWEMHYGAIPDGLLVCHHCDTPECVKPDHLFLGTHQDNTRDAIVKGRHNKKRLPDP